MRKIAAKIDYTATASTPTSRTRNRSCSRSATPTSSPSATRSTGSRESSTRSNGCALGRAYVAFALEYPNHYKLMFMTRHREGRRPEQGQQGNPDQDAYAFLRETIAEGLEAGRFREEFDDADLLAQVVWSGVHGVVSLHLVKGDDPWLDWRPVEATAGVVIDVTIRGLLRERGWGDGGPGAEDPVA